MKVSADRCKPSPNRCVGREEKPEQQQVRGYGLQVEIPKRGWDSRETLDSQSRSVICRRSPIGDDMFWIGFGIRHSNM